MKVTEYCLKRPVNLEGTVLSQPEETFNEAWNGLHVLTLLWFDLSKSAYWQNY